MSKNIKEEGSKRQAIFALDPIAISMARKEEEEENLEKKEGTATRPDTGALGILLKTLKQQETISANQRMAFEIDPHQNRTGVGALWRQKIGLTPDHILKRIAGPQGDELVNQIVQCRANFMASAGRPRSSRFSVGFEFQEINEQCELSDEQKRERVEKLKDIIWNCGYKGLEEDWHPNFSQFLKMITRDAIVYGRLAFERIYAVDPKTGENRFHSFRAVDAGTIYRILPNKENDQQRRKQALELLSQIKNRKFDPDRYAKDEYLYVQVVQGQPVQVFTEKELTVYTIYPTTNVEFNGYPLTPIDQALNAISTHINITLHNKLFFEHGRASRGMLVFKSDDIDEGTIQKIRLQFHQSINSVQNSWRMPVFAVGADDEVRWESIDVAGRDKEFQYMADDNARVIMGAFQISPDELPGYSHLSRGTNTQALSESDNEYKLTAARDVGLRPLIYDIQDCINIHILPHFDKEIGDSHQLVFAGLEKDSPEKEATRLAQDMPIHMTYDDVLDQVEKEKIGATMGGEFPLNPQWQQAVAPYLTVGQIMEVFFKVKDAAKDPRFNYYRDPMWLQWQQILMQKAQMALQTQMAAQQAQMAQQQPQQPGEEGSGGQPGEPPPEPKQAAPGASNEEKQQVQEDNAKAQSDWLQRNYQHLSKSIDDNHNTISKMILARHKQIVDRNLDEWKKKSEMAIDAIVATVKDHEDHDH